ncbi:MAG: hypothetical protein V2I82_05630 [Halieaceae bacterium]|jgi:hypothetical protein|nr:hypothetical protein [Halieaceae bacterium]
MAWATSTSREARPPASARRPALVGSAPIGLEPARVVCALFKRVLLAVSVALALVSCSREAQVSLGPGIRAPLAPLQEALDGVALERDGFQLSPRARFETTAKLLSKRRYRWDDLAAVAPWDFAIAWGPLSDEGLLAGTKVLQGNRLMFWHLYGLRLPRSLVERSSANVHLIAGTASVGERLAAVPVGAIVTLRGRLVDLRLPDQRVVPTSLSRYDSGVGACEILLVEQVSWES